jgi:acyl-CoA synthetase (AMP-forming)/AMP-acid ligase II
MFTPYGATESLPVSAVSAREVLTETVNLTRSGKGTCVGRPFPGVRVKIVEITTGPLASLHETRELPRGEIGEILVQSASTTRQYFRRPEATALSKVPDGDGFWHRMGDVGYFDDQGRLWYCGRKTHIVETEHGRLFTDCVEPILNTHPAVSRTALVGIGPVPRQTPVIVAELESGRVPNGVESERIAAELKALHPVGQVLFHPSLPVDVRHNVKINREYLAVWAAQELANR